MQALTNRAQRLEEVIKLRRKMDPNCWEVLLLSVDKEEWNKLRYVLVPWKLRLIRRILFNDLENLRTWKKRMVCKTMLTFRPSHLFFETCFASRDRGVSRNACKAFKKNVYLSDCNQNWNVLNFECNSSIVKFHQNLLGRSPVVALRQIKSTWRNEFVANLP